MRTRRAVAWAAFVVALAVVAVTPHPAAGDEFMPGLAAHYYRDPTYWDGRWPDTVSVPDANPNDWTFTNYQYTRVEPLISHLFIRSGWFSVRWKGYLTIPPVEGGPQELTYRFSVWADDGCRLYIDDQKLIDDWRACPENSPTAWRSASVKLAPGRHRIVVEYFQGQSLREKDADPMRLYWECEARQLRRQIVPETQFSHTAAELVATPGRLDGAGAAK